MSNISNVSELVKQAAFLHTQKTSIYLYYKDGNYFITNSEPAEVYSVVKHPYQYVPSCCVSRWYYKAINEARYQLNNLRA